jgi:hypothetical protein
VAFATGGLVTPVRLRRLAAEHIAAFSATYHALLTLGTASARAAGRAGGGVLFALLFAVVLLLIVVAGAMLRGGTTAERDLARSVASGRGDTLER